MVQSEMKRIVKEERLKGDKIFKENPLAYLD